MQNQIVNLKIVNMATEHGPVPVVVMALDLPDIEGAGAFLAAVVERWKLMRMTAPPDTSAMLITVVTPMPVSEIVAFWRALADQDPILRVFMEQMMRADVLRGLVPGETLETASLLRSNLS